MERKRQSRSPVGSILQIIQKWTVLRAVRLGVGLLLMAEALRSQNWFMTSLAAAFIIMPLVNIGCSSRACGIPAKSTKDQTKKDPEFEEFV